MKKTFGFSLVLSLIVTQMMYYFLMSINSYGASELVLELLKIMDLISVSTGSLVGYIFFYIKQNKKNKFLLLSIFYFVLSLVFNYISIIGFHIILMMIGTGGKGLAV